jgi:hypothetical protein
MSTSRCIPNAATPVRPLQPGRRGHPSAAERTTHHSLPSGSWSTWNVPTVSAWIVPTLTAPRASAAADARGTSSTCTSICRRFFPCLVSGTRWKAKRVHPGGSMKDHAPFRCTGSPPRMEDQNSASAAGFWQSSTTSSTRPIIFRAYRRSGAAGTASPPRWSSPAPGAVFRSACSGADSCQPAGLAGASPVGMTGDRDG